MTEVQIDRRPRWQRRLSRLRYDPWHVIMQAVGDRSPGLGGPPLNWYSRKRTDKWSTLYLSAGDDGRNVSLSRYYADGSSGDRGSPVYEVHHDERLFLLRFVVWGYIVDWFGLRRRLYYVALTKHPDRVAPHRRAMRAMAARFLLDVAEPSDD